MSLNASLLLLCLILLHSRMNKSVHNMPAKMHTEVSFSVLLKLMEHDVTFLDVFGVYKTEQTAVKAIIDSVSLWLLSVYISHILYSAA